MEISQPLKTWEQSWWNYLGLQIIYGVVRNSGIKLLVRDDTDRWWEPGSLPYFFFAEKSSQNSLFGQNFRRMNLLPVQTNTNIHWVLPNLIILLRKKCSCPLTQTSPAGCLDFSAIIKILPFHHIRQHPFSHLISYPAVPYKYSTSTSFDLAYRTEKGAGKLRNPEVHDVNVIEYAKIDSFFRWNAVNYIQVGTKCFIRWRFHFHIAVAAFCVPCPFYYCQSLFRSILERACNMVFEVRVFRYRRKSFVCEGHSEEEGTKKKKTAKHDRSVVGP